MSICSVMRGLFFFFPQDVEFGTSCSAENHFYSLPGEMPAPKIEFNHLLLHTSFFKDSQRYSWASLVAQWSRICLPSRRRSFDPELGRSPGGGHGNLLQYSCLENPMEEPSRATVHGVIKSWARLNTTTKRYFVFHASRTWFFPYLI